MKRKVLNIAVLILIAALPFASGCGGISTKHNVDDKEQIVLLVSAAASLTDALQEIGALYEKAYPKVKITYNFGSSGALQAQIEAGAPADVFISAGKKQMQALEEKDLLLAAITPDLLLNQLVFIAKKDSNLALLRVEDLAADNVKRIALGEPKSVPAGQYAKEAITNLDLFDQIKGKAVYVSDVRQVLHWVEAGEVDCGIVYATDAATTEKVKVILVAPEGSHQPIVYPVGITKGTKQVQEATTFVNYLSTQDAKEIFRRYGFGVT